MSSTGASADTSTDVPKARPGSAERLELVVRDIDTAREDLISRGVDVGDS